MAENKIIPWAQTGTANVLSDDAYAADVAKGGIYGDGVKTGQASSQQANKTWRQATAPGAGLGQFLVDNLDVDVTDADTPTTFSARIANAVLKLAQISPFNQSWATSTGGYRKYAIVSDSSGNFWVSTADQNTNVPGDDSAKWQSLFDGYATQTWANGRFQPAGDYATTTALQSEASSRANADSNLQNQVNNRVVKTGDTMTGSLNINTPGGGVIASGNGGGDNVHGRAAYSAGFTSSYNVGSVTQAIYRHINVNGVGPFATIWLTDNYGGFHELRYGADDRLRTASGNVFALTSELPLDPNKIILAWNGYVGAGEQSIPFPRGLSYVDTVIVVCSTQAGGGHAAAAINVQGWNNSSVQVHSAWFDGRGAGDADTNYRAIVIGNK